MATKNKKTIETVVEDALVDQEPLDDDEVLLGMSEDMTLEEADAYGLYKQAEGVVTWRIANLYDDEGKLLSKGSLKANPPVITFEDGTGASAEFTLTKEFAGSLSRVFERIYYGYHGLDKRPKKKHTWKTIYESFLASVGARPIQSFALGALFVLAFIAIVLP